MKKLYISDFTLRKLAQTEGDHLLFREKTAIASCIEKLGADQVELPAVTRPREDRIIYKTVAAQVSARLAVPAGYDAQSVEQAWQCIQDAKAPCLQVMLPVATAQMEYGFRAKAAAMLENAGKLVALAKEKCPHVEFSALDATRAEPEFLAQVCQKAEQAGADCITLCDDLGTSLPSEIAALVEGVKKVCHVPVLVRLTDCIGLGPTCAVAAIRAGADGVKTSMVGPDELLTEQLARLVEARGESLGVSTALRTTELHRDISELLRSIRREQPAVQQDGVSAADVYLDSRSTLSDVCQAAAALGYTLSDEDNGKVFRAVEQICRNKSSVGAKELEALIASYAMQVPSTYHLVSYTASCSSLGASMAQVNLQREGENFCGVSVGDGPIDAAFRAIEQCIGYHYELDDFQIQAVTEGKEALGSTLVRLRNNGKLYAGNGLSTDIVGSSIRAYINALNKIVFEEQ